MKLKEPVQYPYDIRDEIRAAIDAYEWKHSWHLPSDQYGHTEWSSPETWKKCVEVLRDYRSGAIQFAAQCDRLSKILEHHIEKREREDREDAEDQP